MKNLTNILKWSFVFLLLQGMVSCMDPIVMTDNGKTYNLSIDEVFQIQLPGNPTTGYSWRIMPYDETVVKQLGEPSYKVNDDKIGTGGIYTFKFQTIADGQAELILNYARKWDSLTEPSRTFKIMIVSGTMGQILEE
ncbi:MAG: protease inhibitor I42 family protein [Bacteroidales bacterium]|jgi:inhibitor of cysteine peptidase|nr:protease inhibitor I42 family protein [Bacteroidales bacterium]